MNDFVTLMQEMGLWPVHGWCRCGGYGAMTITENVAEWRCDRCGVFLTSAGAASRPAPDVDAIAREAAEAVMHEHTNPNLDTGVAAAIIREAIEKATGHE